MPKKQHHELCLHNWMGGLTFQQQALLLTIMRGPDENNKYNAAKAMVRYMRGCVIKPAGKWNGTNDNDFMWGSYDRSIEIAKIEYGEIKRQFIANPFQYYSNEFFNDHDEYPHHFIMHLAHCAEVVGYKFPCLGVHVGGIENYTIKMAWKNFYLRCCETFHMNPETEAEMDERLDDFGLIKNLR